ncbi:HNH endonuclease [Chitinophaga sp. HK235]|uniref:HNH endonuclease n=1 Tax=Chitinophaga sp. HK235 TaxID=2952571 RepID=UPI001BAA66A0|nr:HNH endonuclease signature motif containing protein [Chitinophaga sp. HK235]
MRPLNKGTSPVDQAGTPIAVSDYDRWRKLLIERIGYYCCYCNIPLSHNLQVEHVVPKNPPPGYAVGDPLAWDNMLLACGPCNRTKWNQPVDFNDYYFPEKNNTLIPFEIIFHPVDPSAAIVNHSEDLQLHQQSKARSTIDLMGLNVIDQRADIVDIRYMRRRDAILMVDAAYGLFQDFKHNNPGNLGQAAERVAILAKGVGFFTLWFDKFEQEPVVISALINPAIIPGTAQDCFDTTQNYQLIPRNPGNPVDPI